MAVRVLDDDEKVEVATRLEQISNLVTNFKVYVETALGIRDNYVFNKMDAIDSILKDVSDKILP